LIASTPIQEEKEEEKMSGTASKESDPLLRAKADVEQVRGIMQQNIEKVIERGDKIEDLQANSEALAQNAQTFQRSSKQIHKQMYWKNMKLTIIIVVVVLVILAIIIVPLALSLSKN